MSYPVLLDELQRVLGVEVLHHHHRAAVPERHGDVAQRGGVVERRRRQIDRVRREAVAVHRLAHGEALVDRHLRQRPQDALRPPGGAGGIEHGIAHPLRLDRRRRHRGDGGLVGLPPIDGPVDHQPDRAVRDQRRDAHGALAAVVGGEDRLRHAVVHDVGGVVGRQVAVHSREVEAGAERGPHHLHEGEVVLHQDSDVVAARQAFGLQELRDLVGAVVELAVADRSARLGDDDRRLLRRRLGLVGDEHAASRNAPTFRKTSTASRGESQMPALRSLERKRGPTTLCRPRTSRTHSTDVIPESPPSGGTRPGSASRAGAE